MKSLKSFVLSHKFLYELYFLLFGKKINRKKIDKKILALFNTQFSEKQFDENLIVSLTTYGERINDLKYTLYSLVQQSVKPKKIIVWLSEDEFSLNTLPSELKQFINFGVEFSFCKDYRSYKKLYPTILLYPDCNIVTADDDIYYKPDWLKKLLYEHNKSPEDIITHIAHKVEFDSNKKMLPYKKWISNVTYTTSNGIYFPTTGGGTLFPPNSLFADCMNHELFTRLSPLADDVWFFFMGLLNKKKIVIVHKPNNRLRYVDIYKEYGLNNKSTLQSQNVTHNLNDEQIRNIMKYYNLTDEDLFNFPNGK